MPHLSTLYAVTWAGVVALAAAKFDYHDFYQYSVDCLHMDGLFRGIRIWIADA